MRQRTTEHSVRGESWANDYAGREEHQSLVRRRTFSQMRATRHEGHESYEERYVAHHDANAPLDRKTRSRGPGHAAHDSNEAHNYNGDCEADTERTEAAVEIDTMRSDKRRLCDEQ